MKTITIKGITGVWNCSYYSSKEDFARIYVSNNELHISKEELFAIMDNSDKCNYYIRYIFNNMNTECVKIKGEIKIRNILSKPFYRTLEEKLHKLFNQKEPVTLEQSEKMFNQFTNEMYIEAREYYSKKTKQPELLEIGNEKELVKNILTY